MQVLVNDFVKTKLDNYLHKNTATADALLRKFFRRNGAKRIVRHSKISQRQAKKSNLHNKKLRDCRAHLTDTKTQETWKVRFY
jgi:topoisomerase-4 subunit B